MLSPPPQTDYDFEDFRFRKVSLSFLFLYAFVLFFILLVNIFPMSLPHYPPPHRHTFKNDTSCLWCKKKRKLPFWVSWIKPRFDILKSLEYLLTNINAHSSPTTNNACENLRAMFYDKFLYPNWLIYFFIVLISQ